MALLALNFFIGFAGLTIMLLAIYRYRVLVQYTLQITYQGQKFNSYSTALALALFYLFMCGFVIIIFLLMFTSKNPQQTFALTIFLLGGMFIHAIIRSQISMAKLLRQKNVEIMKTFVNAIDLKDSYTKGHSEHVYDLVALIYEHLPKKMQDQINKPKLLDAAMLHDCGKLSIKDNILNKRGLLSDSDWEAIKTHPANGKKMLDDTCFSDLSDWVLYHHERMDGKGYYGISGNEIPLESKIIAIADTYSALSTDRIYRQRYSHETAMEIMALATGNQLDAKLMGCFMRITRQELDAIRPQDLYIYPTKTSDQKSA